MSERIVRFLLPVVGVGFLLIVWAVLSANVQDLPSPLKTWQESKIYILEPLEKTGRDGSGYRAARFVQPVSCGEGFPARDCHRNSARIHPGAFEDVQPDVRSGDSGPAADLAAGLASARIDHLSEVGTGGTVHDRALLDVADGAQHDGGRSKRFRRNIAMSRRFCVFRSSRHSRRCCCRRRCRTCSRDIA